MRFLMFWLESNFFLLYHQICFLCLLLWPSPKGEDWQPWHNYWWRCKEAWGNVVQTFTKGKVSIWAEGYEAQGEVRKGNSWFNFRYYLWLNNAVLLLLINNFQSGCCCISRQRRKSRWWQERWTWPDSRKEGRSWWWWRRRWWWWRGCRRGRRRWWWWRLSSVKLERSCLQNNVNAFF